ncbi:dTDP-4-dehydrorhamnose 3,5-epimerase [Aliivibrio fischeri]|uniref:dTDP-4-dehydrorhamnose 3,5-epimerase family protein n=1 Tax=Aliivibrio fischeri TaxID=668 RepID=UPI00107E65B9|nr:dTDP-4-dehydrorhamnose 3,5-epimerase family protein [Aliivibrio fischeri]MUH96847.1 dTDP-4-dehydrorhamnose 3,5-epimerase [Aliivibrio fischeri]MUI63826.1 dTDP-4-dehydrorhamnose 3,5-epimerase [Aliivibrio fischeri]TGA73364.1 dTDP-4-dehydrorhamnose 3,5-epimerase [Aliivibrio fischeri]
MINGVVVTPLKQIFLDKGSVFHGIKSTDDTFYGFGEAYFSQANYLSIKGWKKHTKMNMNLVVPIGAIKFVIFDDREFSPTNGLFFEIELSDKNYCRLTIPAGLWLAFQGTGKDINLLMNFADILHDPSESQVKELADISYDWSNI